MPEFLQCAVCGGKWVNRMPVGPKRCPKPACRSMKWKSGTVQPDRERLLAAEEEEKDLQPHETRYDKETDWGA